MDKNDKLPTQIIAEVVSAFMQVLQSGEDIETGIGVYRDIAFSVKQLEDVKTVAKSLVESVMRETGESKIVCQSGTAGFTQPKTKKLDASAWKMACASDNDLMRLQQEYDAVLSRLEVAQEPYKFLPDGVLYIR